MRVLLKAKGSKNIGPTVVGPGHMAVITLITRRRVDESRPRRTLRPFPAKQLNNLSFYLSFAKRELPKNGGNIGGKRSNRGRELGV